MKQELDKTVRWPYPLRDYAYRIPWLLVQYTIWRLCWHRFYKLRAGLLKIFGANVYWQTLAFGSTNILRPWDLTLGKNVTLGPRVHIYNLKKINIGDNTVLSQDVYLCGGTHDYKDSKFPLIRKDIIIGNNVWISAGAFIGPGITIGDGAVIGARAVIVKNVEPWTVVGGNPAKFIKKRVVQ